MTEMRRLTKANIRILSKENLPKVASEDDEMVQVRDHLGNVSFLIIISLIYVVHMDANKCR